MGFIKKSRLVIIVAACLAATSCGSDSRQANAAAIIGDTVVSVDDVQSAVNRVAREQPAAAQLVDNHRLDLVARALVGQLVIHELLQHVTRQEGIDVDRGKVDRLVAENQLGVALPADGSVPPDALAQQLAFRARDHQEVYVDQVLLEQLGRKHFDKLAVTFDYTTVNPGDSSAEPQTLRAKAEAKAKRFAASPESAGAVIASDKALGLDAGLGERVAAAEAQEWFYPVFGFPAGTVMAMQSEQQTSWFVVAVRERDLQTANEVEQVAPTEDRQFAAIGQHFLQPFAKEAGLEISPRYGVWDSVSMTVAPNALETAGLVIQ